MLLISHLKMVNGGHFIAVHSISHMKLEAYLLLFVIYDQLQKVYTTHILLNTGAGKKMIATRSGC
jgi:hypothetical protein